MAVFHIIGDQDTVLGFRFAGVTGAAASTAEGAGKAFRAACSMHDCRILLLTAAIEELIKDDVNEHRLSSEPPYVVIVDDILGRGPERESLESMIHEAVGIKIAGEQD